MRKWRHADTSCHNSVIGTMFEYRRRQQSDISVWLGRSVMVVITTVSIILMAVVIVPGTTFAGGATKRTTVKTTNTLSAPRDTTTTSSTPTPTTTTTTPDPTTPSKPGGLIAIGPSRSECLGPNFDDTGLGAVNAVVAKFEAETHSSVSCLSAYLNGEPTWIKWEHPWITSPQYGYTGWIAEQPERRQLVLQVDLIPSSLENVGDPIGWEQSCAAGDFNSFATALGTNLVAAGLQNSVLRLGAEMNGIWEEDFVGTTIVEQHLWATCFANEATALRQATGEHFLIDWNPNACVEDIPLGNYYPGDAYVDIVGLDLFDVSCQYPRTRRTFQQLAGEVLGLDTFEAFAIAHKKPMSLPEWGLKAYPNGDDPEYIDGIGATVARRDFAFQSYFNVNVKIRPYLALGPDAPLALKAFKKWFGDRS